MLVLRTTREAALPCRTPLRTLSMPVCAAVLVACLSGCGKSQAELQAEQAEQDAHYNAGVQAELDRENKLSQHAIAEGEAQAAKTMVNGSAHGPNGNFSKSFASKASAPGAEPFTGDPHEQFIELVAGVRQSLPAPGTTQIQDAHWNEAHNAICGEVDYDNGDHKRSGFRHFIVTMNGSIVDTDAPGVHQEFELKAAHIDCSL